VRWTSHGRARNGVTSTYLADRCKVGDKARIYIKPNKHFGLPADGDRPIVMIGAGTGVAPYRGFVEERAENADKLFLVGSDWISSELHAAALGANAGLPRPFAFDFSMNSPADGGLAYYRSDHFSYASKGVPSVFITSGPHGDYHATSDTADKIDYAKLARVVEYAGALGSRLATLDRPPARDFAGPRAGVLSRPTATASGGVSCSK